MKQIVLLVFIESENIKNVSLELKKKYAGEYYTNSFGKPLSKDLFFNISHSKDVVVFTSSKTNNVGIDIEKMRDVDQKIIDYSCTENEKQSIKCYEDFFNIWTNKEALAKCIGTGLQGKLKEFPSLPFNGTKQYQNQKYSTRSITYKGYILTVCLEGEIDFEISVEEIAL